MRRWLYLALLAAVALAGPGSGAPPDDDKKPAAGQGAPADELKAIKKDFQDMQAKFSKAYQAAKTQEDRQKVFREQRPNPKPFLERSLKLAEAHPDSPDAVDALIWTNQMGGASPEGKKADELLANGFITKAPLADVAAKVQTLRLFAAPKVLDAALARAEGHLDDGNTPKLLGFVYRGGAFGQNKASDKAKQLLIDKFINDDAVADICQALSFVRVNPQDKQKADEQRRMNEEQLTAILDKSTNPKVQAVACYGLATLKKGEGDAGKAEAEKLFERIVKEFSTANKSIAGRARGELNEMRGLLAEGKPALPIEGEDLNGKAFKLADYKGKVVLLDFWGFW